MPGINSLAKAKQSKSIHFEAHVFFLQLSPTDFQALPFCHWGFIDLITIFLFYNLRTFRYVHRSSIQQPSFIISGPTLFLYHLPFTASEPYISEKTLSCCILWPTPNHSQKFHPLLSLYLHRLSLDLAIFSPTSLSIKNLMFNPWLLFFCHTFLRMPQLYIFCTFYLFVFYIYAAGQCWRKNK